MALLQIIQTTTLLFLIYTIGEALRRLYFHPLKHIPGPLLARLTWWYEFYFDVIQGGQYVFKIQEMHKQYGPIIRITPDEIHINDVAFLDTIYASSTTTTTTTTTTSTSTTSSTPTTTPTTRRHRRDKYFYQLRSLRVPGSITAAASHDLHRSRRESLAPFFSRKNVLRAEPMVKAKVKQLCSVVRRLGVEGEEVVNLSDLFFGFANDVVTNFLFAHQSDVLGDEKQAATLRHNSEQFLLGIHVNKHLPWIPDLLEALPFLISKHLMPPGLLDLLSLFERVGAELNILMDAKSATSSSSPSSSSSSSSPTTNDPPSPSPSILSTLLTNPSFPPSERSPPRLIQEGSLLVLAGTESPARTLTVIFYHLLSNPEILATLRAELKTLPDDASWTQLEALEYLGALIEEGNRLSFGVAARMARRAEDEVLVYEEMDEGGGERGKRRSYVIPKGTPVSTTTLSSQTHPLIFPSPSTFNPSRWLGPSSGFGRSLRSKYAMAFGRGTRRCIGVEVARMMLYLLVAGLVRELCSADDGDREGEGGMGMMRLYETGPEEVEFRREYQVAMPKAGGSGVRVVVGGGRGVGGKRERDVGKEKGMKMEKQTGKPIDRGR